MIRKLVIYNCLAIFVMALSLPLYCDKANASVEVGMAAPDFTVTDIQGNQVTLSDYKGKIVVLEWSNHLCPFVVKHYASGNMQQSQKTATEKDVVWLTIVSSAPGKQGHVSAEEAMEIEKEVGTSSSARILDETGEIGKLYGAKTTPHMFVVNQEGNIAYAGAIDSNSSPDPNTIEGATNYVLAALDDIEAGRDVQTPATWPYGCSVKY